MGVLQPDCGWICELFCDCVICPKKCLGTIWIKIIIIQTVKGLFGWFCGQFKSWFRAASGNFFFFFVGIIYATIGLGG